MAYPNRTNPRFGIPLVAAFAALLVATATVAWPTVAAAREKSFSVAGSTTRTIDTLNGREEYRLDQYLNERGEKEVAVYHEEIRAFIDTENVVLYGRDLDRDGRFDAWFLMGKGGVIKTADRVSNEGDGWDVAFDLIRKHPGAMKNRWLIRALFHWLNGYAGFIGRHYFDELERTQMNLHSAEIRADRIARVAKSHPMLPAYYQQISLEWTRMGEETQKKLLTTIAWDAVMIVGPIYVTKAITAVLSRLGIDLAGSSLATYFKNVYENYVRAIVETTKTSATRVLGKIRISPKLKARADKVTGPFRLASARASARVDQLLDVMEHHDAVSRTMAHSFRNVMELGRAGLSHWKYIGQTQSVQLAMEVMNRRDELWSPNPIILGKNIASDKDLIQNLGFMTSETFMLAGMSKLQPNIPKRLIICAALAIVNTVATSYIVKGETDFERIKLDALWESVIGNSQTVLDTAALGMSAHMAEKTGNPHLRLVGYAVALVDQAAGYFAYAEVTQKLSEKQKGKEKQATPASPAQPANDLPVRFVPIYAPI